MAAAAFPTFVDANYCYGQNGGVFIDWKIDVAKDSTYNGNCGAGCLDNLRGRCGAISDWGCNRNPDGGAHYEFLTTAGCTAYGVTQAMLACTRQEQNIPCSIGN